MTKDELLRAWRTNQAVNRRLLDHVSESGLGSTLSARGGRDVARQLGHIHDNRVRQLRARAKDLAEGLDVFPTKSSPSRAELEAALEASADAVGRYLADLADGRPKRRSFRKGVATTLAYLVAHEAHHRGQVLLTLKVAGHPVPPDVRAGLWAWDQL